MRGNKKHVNRPNKNPGIFDMVRGFNIIPKKASAFFFADGKIFFCYDI
jgi:hypothetical protein